MCRESSPPATVVDGHVVHCHVAARELDRAGADPAAAAAAMARLVEAAQAAGEGPASVVAPGSRG